jgi:hypothetical protein
VEIRFSGVRATPCHENYFIFFPIKIKNRVKEIKDDLNLLKSMGVLWISDHVVIVVPVEKNSTKSQLFTNKASEPGFLVILCIWRKPLV